MIDNHINPVTNVWDDNYYATKGQYLPSSSNPIDLFNKYNNDYQNANNNYFNQELGTYQKANDLTLGNLNQQNTYALGTQGQPAQQSFLNSIASPDEASQGRLEYDYNRNLGHENNTYGLQSGALSTNRQMALDKLSNDQKWATANLGLQQGQQNQATLESLNSRGLLYGQQPTGGYQASPMGGMNGVAGQQAGLVNQGFANQYGQLGSDYNLNTQDVNNQFNQNVGMLNENHSFNLNDLMTNTRRNIQDQTMNYGYQTGMANNQLQMYKNSLENQRAQGNLNATLNAKTRAMQQGGITYQ